MTRKELVEKFDLIGVTPTYYSLDGKFSLDKVVLYHSKTKWHIVSLDERGIRTELATYLSEEEALEGIYQLLKKHIELLKKYNVYIP